MMDKTAKRYILWLLVLGTAGPASAQDPVARIRAVRQESNAAIARHDIETQLSFLDSLYQITLGSGGLEHGKASQREGTARAFARAPDVRYVRTPETIEVSASQTRAAEFGNWVGTATENGVVRRWGGRYAAHWVLVDGAWKIRAELFVTLY